MNRGRGGLNPSLAVVGFALACGEGVPRYAVHDPAPADRQRLPAPVTLLFGGDVMVGRSFNGMAERADGFDPWGDLAPTLDSADALILNFEGTVTDHDEAWPNKVFHFRLEPRFADEVLSGLAPSSERPVIWSLANNHSLDFGRPGSRQTRDELGQRGFRFAGTGPTAGEASAPAVFETPSGVRVGVLSATDHCGCERLNAWKAEATREGAWVLRFGRSDTRQEAVDEAVAAVAALRGRVDVLVFSIHWGANWVDDDEGSDLTWMPAVARALIEAGVDVVHGHSAHHSLPVQRMGAGIVIYGAGDLLSDYRQYEGYENLLSYLAKVEIRPDRSQRHRVIPTRIWTAPDGSRSTKLLSDDDPDHELVRAAADPARWDVLRRFE